MDFQSTEALARKCPLAGGRRPTISRCEVVYRPSDDGCGALSCAGPFPRSVDFQSTEERPEFRRYGDSLTSDQESPVRW